MLTRRSTRSGLTLVEVLIGTVIAAVIGSATLTLSLHHERLARALDQRMRTRRAVREGADALRYDLRAISPVRRAIYAMSETSIEVRLTTGFAVLCGIDSTRAIIRVPSRAASTPSLTSWIVAPEAGDTAMILSPAADPDSAMWSKAVLAAPPARGRPCPPAFAQNGDSAASLAIRLTQPLPPSVGTGAAIRFVRRVRYELYRAGDGDWYLGFVDCLAARATPCAIVQPVAGPYTARGLQFRFLDSAGTPTANPVRVRRIDVVLRSVGALGKNVPGFSDTIADSVLFTIVPRD